MLHQPPVAVSSGEHTAIPVAPQKQHTPGLLKDIKTRNGGLAAGSSTGFPAIVGATTWRGGYAKGCYGTSDESSSSDDGGGSGGSGGDDKSGIGSCEEEVVENAKEDENKARFGKKPARRVVSSSGIGG